MMSLFQETSYFGGRMLCNGHLEVILVFCIILNELIFIVYV